MPTIAFPEILSLGKCFSLGCHVGLLSVFVSDSAKKIVRRGEAV